MSLTAFRQVSAIVLLSCAFLLTSFSNSRSADMGWDYTRGRTLDFLRVFISGEIVPGDLAKLEGIYALGEGVFAGKEPIEASKFRDWSCRYAPTDICQKPDQIAQSPDDKRLEPLISIDSPGGDVAEAMLIGHWLRQKRGTVAIAQGARCASACVLILAAGSDKTVAGEVMIHRPYFRELPNSDVGEALRQTLKDTRAYLSEMNIPESLADEMFSIAPEDSVALSTDALTRYRLDGKDIVEQEEEQLERAKQLGITRDELLRRLQTLNQKIGLGACKDKIPNGKPREDSDAWLEYDRCIVELGASFEIRD